MVLKTLEDSSCSLDEALCWSLSAKNALTNTQGFSANQLVFGYNPNTPSILVNKPPDLEATKMSEVVAANINAMHAARRAFMRSESSEKLQKALRHQVRGNPSFQYSSGDLVYFKRPESNNWMGPGVVIGTENKTVFVKHGSAYIKVHPCRVQMVEENSSLRGFTPDEKDDNDDSGTVDVCDQSVHEEIWPEDEEDDLDREDFCSEERSPPPSLSAEPAGVESESVSSSPQRLANKRSKIDGKWHLLQPGTKIRCRFHDPSNASKWSSVKVISRGGKATGANKFVMNVSIDGANPSWLDFKKSVVEWKLDDVAEDESDISDFEDANEALFTSDHSPKEWDTAVKAELESWKQNSVYLEVPDEEQDRIHTRWILSSKETSSGKVPKARLVAKGFQDVDASITRSDSPTCAKESLRLVLAIVASKCWSLNSMDIKTAFLQGMTFDRDVFLLPPREANVKKGRLWKLQKCVYGLTDASRVWYLTVHDKLKKAGMRVSTHDEAVFTFHFDGVLQGIVSTHVDDFCWAGTKFFEAQVINFIRKSFRVKSEERHGFRYLGLDLFQDNKSVHIKQDKFVQSVSLIEIKRKCAPTDCMTEHEISMCRSAQGNLNWPVTQTRPDIGYDISQFTSSLRSRKVEVIREINKVIR